MGRTVYPQGVHIKHKGTAMPRLPIRLAALIGATLMLAFPLSASAATQTLATPATHLTATLAPPASAAVDGLGQSGGTPLRRVDWYSVVLASPGITPIAGCPPAPMLTQWGPCITAAFDPAAIPGGATGIDGSFQVSGYAATGQGDVMYGDIDGDGLEEAVIRIESGGTAGTLGFMVFHQAPGMPYLAVVYPGYKIGVHVENSGPNTWITVLTPFYFPGEANCCPTAITTDRYVLAGNTLMQAVQTGWSITGAEERAATPAEITVVAFYRALSRSDFSDAYALLSPAYRAGNPYGAWKAGYATTTAISVTTAAVRFDQVQVTVTATDQAASGRMTTRTFSGSWTLVQDDSAPLGLLLDSASIS